MTVTGAQPVANFRHAIDSALTLAGGGAKR